MQSWDVRKQHEPSQHSWASLATLNVPEWMTMTFRLGKIWNYHFAFSYTSINQHTAPSPWKGAEDCSAQPSRAPVPLWDRQQGTAAADVPSPETGLASSPDTLCSHLQMISARNWLLVSSWIICGLEFALKEEQQGKVVWTWGKYDFFSGFLDFSLIFNIVLALKKRQPPNTKHLIFLFIWVLSLTIPVANGSWLLE